MERKSFPSDLRSSCFHLKSNSTCRVQTRVQILTTVHSKLHAYGVSSNWSPLPLERFTSNNPVLFPHTLKPSLPTMIPMHLWGLFHAVSLDSSNPDDPNAAPDPELWIAFAGKASVLALMAISTIHVYRFQDCADTNPDFVRLSDHEG